MNYHSYINHLMIMNPVTCNLKTPVGGRAVGRGRSRYPLLRGINSICVSNYFTTALRAWYRSPHVSYSQLGSLSVNVIDSTCKLQYTYSDPMVPIRVFRLFVSEGLGLIIKGTSGSFNLNNLKVTMGVIFDRRGSTEKILLTD
jgi:hypothetical protein